MNRKSCITFCKKIYFNARVIKRKRQKDFAFMGSLIRWKLRARDFIKIAHMDGRGPSLCATVHSFPKCISREPISWDLNLHPYNRVWESQAEV